MPARMSRAKRRAEARREAAKTKQHAAEAMETGMSDLASLLGHTDNHVDSAAKFSATHLDIPILYTNVEKFSPIHLLEFLVGIKQYFCLKSSNIALTFHTNHLLHYPPC